METRKVGEEVKIVDRETFMALPENTLFSKWEPCFFGPLTIKGESWEHDFLTQEIADAVKCSDSGEFADFCEDAARTGRSLELDLNSLGRDGCFDKDQMFAVWERKDVEALVERLRMCIPRGEKK
jgi:hypothetical protein